jgi:cell division protein FtsA
MARSGNIDNRGRVGHGLAGPNVGDRIVSVLDIGTTKVACLICAFSPHSNSAVPRLLGVGYQPSQGMKASVVTDMDAAEEAVRQTIQQAEAMAGFAIEQVYLSVACGRLKSNNIKASTETTNHVVTRGDVDKLIVSGRRYVERDGRSLLHLNAISCRLDDASDVLDPVGLSGRTLSCDLHAASIDQSPLRNLMQVVERCNVMVAGVVPTPYASGLAVTTDAERRDGVIVVDIGGGSTTIAFFLEDHLVSVHAAPMGGNHLTFDIARALSTSVVEAERIKTVYGSMLSAHADEHDLVPYKIAGDQDSTLHHLNSAELRDILSPRVDALIGMISERIETSLINPQRFARVVMTGGGSELVGLADIATDLLDRPLRCGRPSTRSGWHEHVAAPRFSAACGTALVGCHGHLQSLCVSPGSASDRGYLGQVGQWIRESF